VETLAVLGLFGLFLAAFVAGGVLPFPSEVVLLTLLEAGASPTACVIAATAGNVLGALTLYAIGRGIARGGKLAERFEARYAGDSEALAKTRERLDRWGPPALILAWVPLVGDLIPLAAGMARLPLGWVTLWVTLGKAGRYLFVVGGWLGYHSL
jgi:membrane protein YqaA with SNARE-associated domain